LIRKLNYTGRKRIKRSQVRIDLRRNGEGKRLFDIRLSLEDLDLAPDARVFVEAYHRSAYQRFDFGTVGAPKVPSDRYLGRFRASALPLFRVKVVDRSTSHGIILAALDKIRAETVEAAAAGSRSLLFVEYDDLGSRVWELDLEGDWPVLRLNRDAEEIGLIAGGDGRFAALVYPQVFRQILTRVLIEDEHTDPGCDDDWPSLWLKLGCLLPGVGPPPPMGKSEQAAWIDRAVDAFCTRASMLEKFNQSVREGR